MGEVPNRIRGRDRGRMGGMGEVPNRIRGEATPRPPTNKKGRFLII